jgi:hypothetical protein
MATSKDEYDESYLDDHVIARITPMTQEERNARWNLPPRAKKVKINEYTNIDKNTNEQRWCTPPIVNNVSIIHVTVAPTIAPVTIAPTIAPVIIDPVIAPMTIDPVIAPVTIAPVIAPVIIDPVIAPVTIAPVIAPIIDPVIAPVIDPVIAAVIPPKKTKHKIKLVNPFIVTPVRKTPMKQYYNMDIVEQLLLELPYNHPDRSKLNFIKTHIVDGVLLASSKFAKNSRNGRQYQKGMQGLTKSTLARLSNNEFVELDMNNAFPTILLNILKQSNIHSPCLERVVFRRDEVLAEIMTLSKCDYAEAKNLVLRSLFLGKSKRGTNVIRVESAFIDTFSSEMHKNVRLLFDPCPDHLTWARTKNINKGKEHKNPYSTLLSFVVGENERIIMDTVIEVLEYHGMIVEVHKFDGVLLRLPYDIPTAVIDEIRSIVRVRHFIDVNFKQKRIIAPPAAAINVEPIPKDQTLYLFDISVLLQQGETHIRKDIIEMLNTITIDPSKKWGVFSNFSETYTRHFIDEQLNLPPPSHVLWRDHLPTLKKERGISKWFPTNVRYICNNLSDVAVIDRGISIEFKSSKLIEQYVMSHKQDGCAFDDYPHRIVIDKTGMDINKDNGKLVLPKLDQLNPEDISLERLLYIVIAAMGTGKSYQAMRFIEQIKLLLAEKKQKKFRVLIMSARIVQAEAMTKLFKDKLYEAGLYNEIDDMAKWDIVVCQYESIIRLSEAQHYDIILCDEVRAIIQQVPSDTNKDLRLANETFCLHLQNARRVFCFDADMETDYVVRDYMLRIFSKERTRVIKCTHNEIHRTVYRHECIQSLLSVVTWAIKNNKKIAYVCRTKDTLLKLREFILKVDPTRRVQLFYGKSDAQEVKDFFRNPDTEILKYTDVMWNSKVTVGNDISVAMDMIFIVGGQGGSTARDVSQGSGRFRNCPVIHIFLPRDKYEGITTTKEEAMHMICTNENLRKHHYKAISAANRYSRNGSLQVDPDCQIMETFANITAEKMSCFNSKLLSIFDRSGYTIVQYDTILTEELQVAWLFWSEIKKSKPEEANYETAVTFFQKGGTAIDLDPFTIKVKLGTITLQDRYMIDVGKIMKKFKLESIPLIPMDIWMLLVQKPEMMSRLKWYRLTMMNEHDLFKQDRVSMDWAHYKLTITCPIAQSCVKIYKRLTALIGMSRPDDYQTQLSLELSSENLKILMDLIDELAVMRGDQKKKTKRLNSSNVTSTKVKLRDIMESFGRSFVGKQVGSSAQGRTTMYTVGLFKFSDDLDIRQLSEHMTPINFSGTIADDDHRYIPDVEIKPVSKRQKI